MQFTDTVLLGFMCVYLCVCVCVRARACVRACMHARVCVRACILVHVCAWVHSCVQSHIHSLPTCERTHPLCWEGVMGGQMAIGSLSTAARGVWVRPALVFAVGDVERLPMEMRLIESRLSFLAIPACCTRSVGCLHVCLSDSILSMQMYYLVL